MVATSLDLMFALSASNIKSATTIHPRLQSFGVGDVLWGVFTFVIG